MRDGLPGDRGESGLRGGYHRALMTSRRPPSMLGLLLLFAVAFGLSCFTWEPWIPEESRPQPKIVVDPAKLAHPLVLGSPYVDTLACMERRCQKRLRVIVEEPGKLVVTTAFELTSSDDQARVVLESMRDGVVDSASTGRGGDRTDASVLSVTTEVEEPGVYFVLLQSLGGKVPYQTTANLAPSALVSPEPVPIEAPEVPFPDDEPPTRLTKVKISPKQGAAYDPRVVSRDFETYAFAQLPRGEDAKPGTPVERPVDREIRRYAADVLELKGFRQAMGDEQADFVVGFSSRDETRTWYTFFFPLLYDRYDFQPGMLGSRQFVTPREALVIDIVEPTTNRLAWHAWSTKGLGPGVTYGEALSSVIREAVGEVLAGFPPH